MTLVLESTREAALGAPATRSDEGDGGARWEDEVALVEMIASHRAALRELAPHQEWRSVRVDTAWHMERLGLLLRHRDAAAQNAAAGVPDADTPATARRRAAEPIAVR